MNAFRRRSASEHFALRVVKEGYYAPHAGRFLNADGCVNANGDLIGFNMYAYCSNNPIVYVDYTGNFSSICFGPNSKDEYLMPGTISFGWGGICSGGAVYSSAINTYNSAVNTCKNIAEDLENFDSNNEDVEKVYSSNFFSAYKGALVVRHSSDFLTSWSIFRTVFLNHNMDKKSLLKKKQALDHEYGHFLQEQEMGTVAYFFDVGIPSIIYNLISRSNKVVRLNYYNMPWEYDADMRGGVIRKHAEWAKALNETYW